MVPSNLSERVFLPSLFRMAPFGKPALSSSFPTVLSLLTCRTILSSPSLNYFYLLAKNYDLLKLIRCTSHIMAKINATTSKM
jgi:hypothetical protein